MQKYNKYTFKSLTGDSFDCMGEQITQEEVITSSEFKAFKILVDSYGKDILKKVSLTKTEVVELFGRKLNKNEGTPSSDLLKII
jgi:hypothetical protein